MKVKVAFVVVGLNAGGIENYLLRFLIFTKSIINPTVYCKSGKFGDLEDEYHQQGICLKKFSLGYYNPIHYYKFKKELEKENFDAIVDFTGNFAGLILFVAKLSGIKKRIVWYRNTEDKFKKSKLKVAYNSILNKILIKVGTDVLSNSEAAFNYFYKTYNWKNDDRFEVIYNGIDADGFLNTKADLREELNIPVDAFVVGNIGRYNEAKNHKTFIEVAIQLCQQDPNIYFVLCGTGTDIFLRDRVISEGLEKQIILLGLRRDVIKVLNTLDCFYFPSISEGQPNALIEAMVVGIPFVASNIDANKETVPNDLHQYLVLPLDVNQAKDSILKIKEDSDFANKFKVVNWAKSKFDASSQFKIFLDKII